MSLVSSARCPRSLPADTVLSDVCQLKQLKSRVSSKVLAPTALLLCFQVKFPFLIFQNQPLDQSGRDLQHTVPVFLN